MSKSTTEDIKQEPKPQEPGDPGVSAVPTGGTGVGERITVADPSDARPADPTITDAVAREMAKLREELTNAYAEENRLLKERIKQLEEDRTGGVMDQMGKIREEVETLRSKLPRTTRDERAKIEGYYDFDTAAKRYVNENANRELNRARSEFKILGA